MTNDSNPTVPDETAVRAMRDQVYGHPSSDNNWAGCREGWMRPDSVKWLQGQIDVKNPLTAPAKGNQ